MGPFLPQHWLVVKPKMGLTQHRLHTKRPNMGSQQFQVGTAEESTGPCLQTADLRSFETLSSWIPSDPTMALWAICVCVCVKSRGIKSVLIRLQKVQGDPRRSKDVQGNVAWGAICCSFFLVLWTVLWAMGSLILPPHASGLVLDGRLKIRRQASQASGSFVQWRPSLLKKEILCKITSLLEF